MRDYDVSRPYISPAVRQQVQIEAGYRCANPRCREIVVHDMHHIVPVKEDGENTPDNLIVLCPTCHALVHREGIPQRAILAWKGLLVSLNNPHRVSADLLLTLYKEQKRIDDESKKKEQTAPPFRFSGDSLGFLSGLLTSGLIEISRRFSGASYFGGSYPTFEVRLTDKGNALVSAWVAGDSDNISKILSGDVSDGAKFGDKAKAIVKKLKKSEDN